MPAGATYTTLATTTLGSNQATVTFTGISGAYTDLVLIAQAKTDSNGDDIQVFLNNDNSALYSTTRMFGNGTSALSDRATGQTSWFNIGVPSASATSVFGYLKLDLMNYSNTTTFKTAIWRSSNVTSSAGEVQSWVGLYRSTSAVTQITIRPRFGSVIASGSTFSLYGIAAA